MLTSKLELCINIAKSLIEFGPQTIEQLVMHLEVNPISLQRQLGFLVFQNIIKKENAGLSITYVIAAKGFKILEFLKVLPSNNFRGLEAPA